MRRKQYKTVVRPSDLWQEASELSEFVSRLPELRLVCRACQSPGRVQERPRDPTFVAVFFLHLPFPPLPTIQQDAPNERNEHSQIFEMVCRSLRFMKCQAQTTVTCPHLVLRPSKLCSSGRAVEAARACHVAACGNPGASCLCRRNNTSECQVSTWATRAGTLLTSN